MSAKLDGEAIGQGPRTGPTIRGYGRTRQFASSAGNWPGTPGELDCLRTSVTQT